MSVKQTVENVHIRHEAMRIVKKHWLVLLAMTVIVTGISLLVSYGAQWVVDRVVGTPDVPSVLNGQTVPEEVNTLMYGVVMLLTLPLTMGLSMGRIAAELDMVRGLVATPWKRLGTMLGWVKRGLKSAGLMLWIGLWLLLWMLAMLGIIIAAALLGDVLLLDTVVVDGLTSALIQLVSGVIGLISSVVTAVYYNRCKRELTRHSRL